MIQGRILLRLKLPRKIVAGENIDPGRCDSSSISMVDLTNYLKPCPWKARRTVRRQVSSPRGFSSSDQNHSPQVPSSEVSVHPGHPGYSRSYEEEEEMEELGPSDDSGKLKRKLEETLQGTGEKIQKTDSAMESGSHTVGESDIKLDSSDETSWSRKSSSMEGCTDVPAVTFPVLGTKSPETPKKYACCLCDKTFSSHLALGGHKSSHKKFKMIIYNAIDYRRCKKKSKIGNACDQETGENNAASSESVGDDRTHMCQICFKKFPSGQALGGHQRRHWTGNMPDQKTLSAPKILDFDLNELPNEEDADPSSIC